MLTDAVSADSALHHFSIYSPVLPKRGSSLPSTWSSMFNKTGFLLKNCSLNSKIVDVKEYPNQVYLMKSLDILS